MNALNHRKNLTSKALRSVITDLYGAEVAETEIGMYGARCLIDALQHGQGDLNVDAGWSEEDENRIRTELNARGYAVWPVVRIETKNSKWPWERNVEEDFEPLD